MIAMCLSTSINPIDYGILWLFCSVLFYFETLQIQTVWHFEFWFFSAVKSTLFHGSSSYLVQLLALVRAWIILIKGFICSFRRVYT